MADWLARFVFGLAACAGLGTLMGTLPRLGWLCETAGHFRWQYTAVLLPSAVMLALVGRPVAALASLGCAIINLRLIVPFYTPRAAVSGPSTRAAASGRGLAQDSAPRAEETGRPAPSAALHSHTLRALAANVLYSNREHEQVRRCIRDLQPDVVVLAEVTREWAHGLQALGADYPFVASAFRFKGFGIYLLSRLPLERADVVQIGTAGLPSVVARLQVGRQPLTIIGTHPCSPINARRARLRDEQLMALAGFVSSQQGPLILMGDLNTTSWVPGFQRLLSRSGLRDSRVGFGLQPTWPAASPLLRIPIDHCLVSDEVVIRRRWVGPDIGSDHYPIVIDFSIR